MSSVLVVGCGVWGRTVARRLRDLDVLVAVFDPDPAAQSWAVSNGFDVELRLDEVAGCYAHVAVCTPPSHERVRLVQRLAEVGVDSMRLEKPAALCVDDARILKTVDAKIVPALTPFYDDSFRVLQELAGQWDGAVLHSMRTASRTPAHDVSICADLMIHDAAIHTMLTPAVRVEGRSCLPLTREVATLDADGRVVGSMFAGRSTTVVRTHRLRRGDDWAVLDEEFGRVLVNGDVVHERAHGRDPLGIELAAWLEGNAYPLQAAVLAVELLGDNVLNDHASVWGVSA